MNPDSSVKLFLIEIFDFFQEIDGYLLFGSLHDLFEFVSALFIDQVVSDEDLFKTSFRLVNSFKVLQNTSVCQEIESCSHNS